MEGVTIEDLGDGLKVTIKVPTRLALMLKNSSDEEALSTYLQDLATHVYQTGFEHGHKSMMEIMRKYVQENVQLLPDIIEKEDASNTTKTP